MTALTLTETLSREITSCGGTSSTTHAQVDAHHLLDERHEQNEARPLGAGIAAEREHDAALVFAQDFDRGVEEHQHQNDDDGSRLRRSWWAPVPFPGCGGA